MGKWPILDKIEMIDGPIDDEDLRARAGRSCSTGCSTCRSIICAPAAGSSSASTAGMPPARAASSSASSSGLEPKSRACLAHRRTDARGTGPPLSVALLATAAGAGQLGDLRPHLVRPRAGRAHRGPVQRRGLEARLSRDQRVRARAGRRRRAHRQAPRSCQRRGAEEAHDRSAEASRTSTTRSGSRTSATSPSASSISRPTTTCSSAPTPTTRRGTSSRPTTSAGPAQRPRDRRSRKSARASKLTEQKLDPAIAEAAFKLWGWKPDKKTATTRRATQSPQWFGFDRTIEHGRPADRT